MMILVKIQYLTFQLKSKKNRVITRVLAQLFDFKIIKKNFIFFKLSVF